MVDSRGLTSHPTVVLLDMGPPGTSTEFTVRMPMTGLELAKLGPQRITVKSFDVS